MSAEETSTGKAVGSVATSHALRRQRLPLFPCRQRVDRLISPAIFSTKPTSFGRTFNRRARNAAALAAMVIAAASGGVSRPAYGDDANASGVQNLSHSLEEVPTATIKDAVRVALRVEDQPQLSGEYRIGDDFSLSVPVVGRISVADMTIEQLEKTLTKRIGELTGRATYVTAEITAYQSVYVTGMVSKPGALEWRPGLTVLQAEALAGGLYRGPEQLNGNGGTGRIEALRSMRKAQDEQMRALASLARLRAEKSGADTIETPADLVALAGVDQARALIDAQQDVLDSRRVTLDKQLAALKQGRELASAELKGLDDQDARVAEQLQMRRGQQESLAKLLQKGLIESERTLEGEIKIAELEEKATNVAVARARVQSTIASLTQNEVALQADRNTAIASEISNLESQLAQANIDFETASQSYLTFAAAETQPSDSSPKAVIQYAIVRRSPTREEKSAAQTSSFLRAGDVLIVSQIIQNTEKTSANAATNSAGQGGTKAQQ